MDDCRSNSVFSWEYLRATEGWAAFQHHAVLKTTLNIQPPAAVNSKKPQFLVVSLKQGSYFALRPQRDDYSGFVPSWYPGNIYDLEDALPVSIRLPDDISTTKPTKLDLFVSGDYEVRLSYCESYFYRDPHRSGSSVPLGLSRATSLVST